MLAASVDLALAAVEARGKDALTEQPMNDFIQVDKNLAGKILSTSPGSVVFNKDFSVCNAKLDNSDTWPKLELIILSDIGAYWRWGLVALPKWCQD